MIPAIVLAGGLGTRVRAVSGDLPKPMIPVDGRPFIEYVLDLLLAADVPEIHLAVSYRRELIRAYFGTQYHNVPVKYSIEEIPLGTGGAIVNAFRNNSFSRALVLNGDTFFQIDIKSLVSDHVKNKSLVTLALCHVPHTARYGAVSCDDSRHVVAFNEKSEAGPGLINGGIYVVDRSALELIDLPSCFSFERDFLGKNLKTLHPLGVVCGGYFLDIGVPEDLDRAKRDLPKVS